MSGKAVIVNKDRGTRKSGEKSQRWLKVKTSYGENVLVLESPKENFTGIRSGQQVELEGVWLSRGAGGVRPVSGFTHAEATNCFVGTKVRKVAGGEVASGRNVVAQSVQEVPVSDQELAAMPAGARRRLLADGSVRQAAVSVSFNQLVTREISTIIIPIAGFDPQLNGPCPGTEKPRVDVNTVRKRVFEELNAGMTVGKTFNQCSFKKSVFNSTNSKVVNLVTLPCSGITNGVSWTFTKCDFDDFNGWADAADEYLTAKGVVLSKHKYRVYLIPPSLCGFVGLGYVGCDGSYTCRSWIGGDFWADPQATVHEMGHNMFLAHAGSYNPEGVFDDYLDDSCTMGYCCNDRCPNTAHAYQMGWLSAWYVNGTTDATVVSGVKKPAPLSTYGTWLLVTLPSQIWDNVNGKVHVYTSCAVNTFDPKMSTLVKSLNVATLWPTKTNSTNTWFEPKSRLVIAFQAKKYYGTVANGAAVVGLCRMKGKEDINSCKTLVDNDCNGKFGKAGQPGVKLGQHDPACTGFSYTWRRTNTVRTGRRLRK